LAKTPEAAETVAKLLKDVAQDRAGSAAANNDRIGGFGLIAHDRTQLAGKHFIVMQVCQNRLTGFIRRQS